MMTTISRKQYCLLQLGVKSRFAFRSVLLQLGAKSRFALRSVLLQLGAKSRFAFRSVLLQLGPSLGLPSDLFCSDVHCKLYDKLKRS